MQVRYIYESFQRLRPGSTLLSLYGTMKQIKRVKTYEEFCRKQNVVLFATDVAARGLGESVCTYSLLAMYLLYTYSVCLLYTYFILTVYSFCTYCVLIIYLIYTSSIPTLYTHSIFALYLLFTYCVPTPNLL